MQRLFRSKKREAQRREESNLEASEHTANDATESNRKDTIADTQRCVDPETKTVPRLGVAVLHEPSKPTAAVVE